MILKYRNKTTKEKFKAIQWNGKSDRFQEIKKFIKNKPLVFDGENLILTTLDGEIIIYDQDYIVKDSNGKFFHCKFEVYKMFYEINPTD